MRCKIDNSIFWGSDPDTSLCTALLRLLYGIFISTFTQDKLKDGQQVILPINESAVMKEHLAAWISEGVTIMNEKKREKVVHCWEKTGLLAILDVN